MNFEDSLLRGLPHAEAAEFFLRIRGKDKLAVDAAALEAAILEMPEAEQAEFRKTANMMPAAPAALPQTGKGMNMAPVPTPPLPPTAMGQQAMKIGGVGDSVRDALIHTIHRGDAGKARESRAALLKQKGSEKDVAALDRYIAKHGAVDKSPEEVGKERATAAASAHFEKEKHHQHESNRELIGHLGGAALGFAGGQKLKGNATSKVLATLAGSHIGGIAGKHSGQEADRRDWKKKHAEAFKLALDSMGLTDSGMAPQMSPQQTAPAPQQTPASVPKPMPQVAGIEPQLPPAVQEYLAAQQAGDQAAEQGHADFLRGKLEEARAAQQAAEEQATTLQGQQELHDQQQMEIQQQVSDSIAQASQAQDQVLQEQQAAAALRMAYQQLRGQVLQIASSDPPALSSDAAAMSAASTAAAPQSGPAAGTPQAGPAGQAPSPGTPNTPAPQGDETVTDKIEPNEPTFSKAEPTTQVGQKEPQGDAKTPNKEVLSHYLPLALRRLAR